MTEAQKRANAKYAKNNMTCLSCSIRKADAERYKALAASKGITIQALFKEALRSLEE